MFMYNYYRFVDLLYIGFLHVSIRNIHGADDGNVYNAEDGENETKNQNNDDGDDDSG